jgi:signal transduction histidine kinase
MAWTPRLRTVLFAVTLAILLLPLGGVVLLRLYESVLVRRTEALLIAQGAFVAAAYRSELREALPAEGEGEGAAPYGVEPASPPPDPDSPEGDPFRPIPPKLDLARDPILPDAAEATAPDAPPDPAAAAAGARLVPVLRDAQKVTLAGIRIVDFRGTVVATSRSEMGLSLAHREEVRRALRGEHVTLMRERTSDSPAPALDSISRGTGVRVFVALPVIEEGRVWGAVVLSRTPQGVTQSLYNVRWVLAGGALALLLAVALVTALTSARITRPVHELIRRTERVAEGDWSAAGELESPGTHEIGQLSRAFAGMARALEERAEYVHTFASGVSHELKTPLTSLRGAVELLRDHLDEMSGEERERFLGNLEEDAKRLERLVNRLLELARAEVVRPSGESAPVGEVVDALAARYRAEGLDVRARCGDAPLRAAVSGEVLESLLANLLDNARQHAGPEAGVEISARTVPPGYGVEISVKDAGPGIAEADLPRVFDRFFTTARGRGGSGLGLAIVKALAEAHGGTVTVSSRPGETVFRVLLPAAPY